MSLDSVYDALARYLTGDPPRQSIDLVAASEDAALELVRTDLATLRIEGSFILAPAELTRNDTTVRLEGNATWRFAGGQPSAVRVLLAATDGGELFSLSLLPLDLAWTFGRLFVDLPVTPAAAPNSVLADLRVDAPTFNASVSSSGTATSTFAGNLPATSVAPSLRGYFGPYPLELLGPIDLPRIDQTYPTMALFGNSLDTHIGVTPLEVEEVGLRIVARTNAGYPLRSQYPAESLLELSAAVEVGGTTGHLRGDLSGAGTMWPLSLTFAAGEVTIGGTLALLAGLLGLDPSELSLPEPFPGLGGFSLTEIDAGVYPDGPAIDHVGVTIETTDVWRPPVPFLVDKISVAGVGTRWVAYWSPDQTSPSAISGSIFGTVSIGRIRPLKLLVTAYLPDFVIEALQDGGEEADLREVIAVFFGSAPKEPNVMLSSMSLIADLRARTFSGTLLARLDDTWKVGEGASMITLSTIGLGIRAGGGSLGADVTAVFVIGSSASDDAPRFSLSARYETAESWTFEGGLEPGAPLKLTELVSRFVGNPDVPPDVVNVQVDALWLMFKTGNGAYAFTGAVSARWSPELFGRRIAMTAGVAIEVSRTGRDAPSLGSITGTFGIDRLAVTAAMSLRQPKQPTYLFRVAWDGTWVSAVTAWRTDPATNVARQVITLTLGGKTLGELITYLANLALPGSNFTLDAPWDLLNRIELSAFAVTIDPGASAVELVYDASVDLGFASISKVGLRYARTNGQGSVQMILVGSVVGRTYPADKPLSWDVLSQRPPATPGTSSGGTLEVRFLGVGQRVALVGALPTTVGDAVARLAATMKEAPSPTTKPLPPGLGFSAAAGWLVGLDLSVLGTVDLALLFADPVLYGMSVGLRGDRAGPLAGLRFEILYRKISEDVGVYRIELRVPEAFRRMDVGVLSVTVGIVVVEIYTNGGFKVDFGFPFKQDFTRSFGLSYLPFVGRGGFYLGVLDGTTSSRVPRVMNGAFSPVLEAGIGLAIGVGKEFSAGPISGAVSVEARVIFEGVFAWFNPSDANAAPSMYVWVAGLAGVYGKMSGRADFGVIVVNVTVDAWAEARVVFELYRPTLFAMNVGVRVYASVDFWFFTAEFSFDLRLDTSITVGSTDPTPWILAPGAAPASRTASALPAISRRPALRQMLLAAAVPSPRHDRPVTWEHLGRRKVDAELLPAFTATGITVGWNEPVAPAARGAVSPYRVAFGLGVRGARGQKLARGSACDLVELLLRYSLRLELDDESDVVTVAQLASLADRLRAPGTIDGPFGIDALSGFFAETLVLRIGGRPTGRRPTTVTGTTIPLPPFLRWRSGSQSGHLATDYPIGAEYVRDVAAYVDEYLPGAARRAPVTDASPVESFATWAFRDWCQMVARSSVEAAQDALAAWQVTGVRTLRAAARTFPAQTVSYAVRVGDTLPSVAAAVGASPGELLFLQPDIGERIETSPPGTVLALRLGVAPDSLAADNADVRIRAARSIPLGEIQYRIRPSDTLRGIARAFGLAGPTHVVAMAAGDPRLLVPGCALAVPAVSASRRRVSALVAAATYFGRYAEPVLEQTPWYVEALVRLNEAKLKRAASQSPHGVLRPGLKLVAPAGYGNPEPGDRYRTIRGDTVERIAVALALAQNYATGRHGPTGWARFRKAVLAADGLEIPPWTTSVRTGESLDSLAARLVTDTRAAAGWFATTRGLLAPLAALPLRGAFGRTRAGDSLGTLAARYGLDVEELGDRVSRVSLFAPGTTLVARHVLAQRVDRVAARVASPTSTGRIVGLAARLLLGGIQLPRPAVVDERVRGTGDLLPFAELTRQQLTGPVPDPSSPDDVALRIEFERAPDVPWVQLKATKTRPSGAVARGREVRSLVYVYTNAELVEAYPPLTMTVAASFGPAPLAAATAVPRTYGLDHRIALHSTVELLGPGSPPLVGVASLWPFPAALVDRARSGSTDRYDVVRLRTRDDLAPGPLVVGDATFAALIPFGISRIGDGPEYALVGVAPGDRDALRAIVDGSGALTGSAYLLVRPAPDAADATGRVVFPGDPAATYLLMTNESTETVIPPGIADEAAGGFHASLAAPDAFARLLWQGSVVGGAGYYLGTGAPLPPAVFDDSGQGQLALLFVPGGAPSRSEGHRLHPFTNVALVGADTDPRTHALYVEGTGEGDLTTRALVAPGEAGFSVVIVPPTADDRIGRLFSLVGWSMPAGPTTPGAPHRPAPPTYGRRSEPLPARPWERARRSRWLQAGRDLVVAAEDHWIFESLVPVARYGPASPLPRVPGLPPPEHDPYRTINAVGPGDAIFDLTFSDVFGNRSAGAATVAAPLTYVDELCGPSGWPALSTWFDGAIDPDGGPTLLVSLAPQPGAWARDGSEPPSVVAERIATQAERYSVAVYQFMPPRVRTTLRSTLIPGKEPEIDGWTLWRYAVAGHIATSAVAALEPLRGGPSVASIRAAHDVTTQMLAATNADVEIAWLYDVPALAVPAAVPFAEGDSAASILSERHPGWPRPADTTELLLLNADLPLRADAVLNLPAVAVGVRGRTLYDVAAGAATTSALLASDSQDAGHALADGFVFEWDGASVTTATEGLSTFAAVVAAFADQGAVVGVGDLAVRYAAAPGLLRPDGRLISGHYVAQSWDTLSNNDSGCDATALAATNARTVNLFENGSFVQFGDFPSPEARPAETLGGFASRYGCPTDVLLAHNADVSFRDGRLIVVPGITRSPDATMRVPYSIVANDTFDGIAERFGANRLDLGRDNAEMPATIRPGRTVVVATPTGTAQTRTIDDDSLESVLRRLEAVRADSTLEDLLAAIGGVPGMLMPGAVLSCPPGLLRGEGAISPGEAARTFGVAATLLAEINSSAADLVVPGVRLSAAGVEVTSIPGDTFASLVRSFAATVRQQGTDGTAPSLAEVIAANSERPFLRAGSRILLPPAPVVVVVRADSSEPMPDPVTPLDVSLCVSRDARLVDPAFQGGPVERLDLPLRPSVSAGTAGSLSLDAFVDRFLATFPRLRLATGQPKALDGDLWVVAFDREGIQQVDFDVPGSPRFFALRPLFPELVTRAGVPIAPLRPDGTLGDPVATTFVGIDVELLARQFLSDVDRFLEVPVASAVYRDEELRPILDRVLGHKRVLANRIAEGLGALLTSEGQSDEAAHSAAVTTLRQVLLVSLAEGYATSTLLQYEARVDSAWANSNIAPARLVGTLERSRIDPASPSYALTGAKLDLAHGRAFLTSRLTVPDPGAQSSLPVRVSYDVGHLEHDIHEVVEGYEASRWLTFLPLLSGDARPKALATTIFDEVSVPIPLRTYPQVPHLVGQAAVPSESADPPPLERAGRWDYEVTYAHEHAAQDEVAVTVRFNAPKPQRLDDVALDVAAALARYQAVAAPIWGLLHGLVDARDDRPASAVRNAVRVFERLVGEVAAAWGVGTPAGLEDHREGGSSYTVSVRLRTTIVGERPLYATATVLAGSSGPGPHEAWPHLTFRPATGPAVPLLRGVPTGRRCLYTFPPDTPVEPGVWPQLTLMWPELSVTEFERAQGSLVVTRNAQLLGPGGPDTAPAFVLHAGEVAAAAVVTPLIEWSAPIDITAYGDSFADALSTALTMLFGDQDVPLTVSAGLSYAIVLALAGGDGVVTTLPVMLFRQRAWAVRKDLVASLEDWLSRNPLGPAAGARAWRLSITLDAQYSDTERRPLLQLRTLVYRLVGAS